MRTPFASALAVLLAAVACAGSSAGGYTPSLRLVRDAVRGTHFRPHERVRVSFTGSADSVRRLRTSATGVFTTAVPPYDPCLGPLLIVATGGRGDSARLKLPQRACPPAARAGG